VEADGADWATATTLEHALEIAVSGDQIWISNGTYVPSSYMDLGNVQRYGPQAKTYTVPAGAQLYGGMPLGSTSLTEQDIANYITILSGDHNGNDTQDNQDPADPSRTDNCWKTVTVTEPGDQVIFHGLSIHLNYRNLWNPKSENCCCKLPRSIHIIQLSMWDELGYLLL